MVFTRLATSRRLIDLFKLELRYVLTLLVLNICFFSNVWLRGKSISKLSRIAEWDSIFQDYSSGAGASCDPSLVQLLVPNYFFVAEQWHKLVMPLWNPFSACGMPLVGDIQATIFSPLRLLLSLFPSVRTYNLILVSEVFIAGVGVFTLARLLRVSRASAMFAAIAYCFCPYFLYYLELLSGTSQALLPLLCASFVYTARFGRGLSALLLPALFTAGFILSGHPESSLYAVVIASCLFFFIRIRDSHVTVTKAFFELFVVALFSFCFTAPALLPFIEFLKCGDSYKYGVGISAFAPWQGLFLNLLQPISAGASPYLGGVALLLLPLCLHVARASRYYVLLLVSITVAIVFFLARLFPIDLLLSIKPFTYLVTVYLIPCLLLFLCLLAGVGLDSLFCIFLSKRAFASKLCKQMMLPLLVSVILPLWLYLFLVDLRICDFDQTIPATAINMRGVVTNGLVAGAFFTICSAFAQLVGRISAVRAVSIIGSAAICLNFFSLALASRNSMPVQPLFTYPETRVTELLERSNSRVLSVIEHVLKPNVNIVYAISSFRVHNPLLPARFAAFSQLCGASLDEFRNQTYSGKLTNLVDLASIKLILTQFKPLPDRYKLLYTSKQGIAIYENPQALPEAYLVGQELRVQSEIEARQAVSSPAFDCRKAVVIEPMSSAAAQIDHSKESSLFLPLKAVRKNGNQVSIDYSSTVPAYMVLTDTFYPGWNATIDGQPTEIFRANYLFRAVHVPSGIHRVRFEYWPFSLVAGLGLLFFGILVAFTIILVNLPKQNRRRAGAM
jgi:hypothetical protein